MKRFGSIIAKYAFAVTGLNVNSACLFIMHQPKLPIEAEKLRKF